MAHGYVYLLGNTAMRGFYKIGRCGLDPYTRAKQLSSNTSVPEPFKVMCFIEVEDAAAEERFLHEVMTDFRHSFSREFFRFASVHMGWVWGVFEYHPRSLCFHEGRSLLAFPGIRADVNPWTEDHPGTPDYAPDYAYVEN